MPFHTLSDLDAAAAASVVRTIGQQRNLDFRLTRDEYLPRRRAIEAEMRTQFLQQNGKPVRKSPHYAVLGTFSLYENDPDWKSLAVSLDQVASDVVSFTLTDSFFTFSTRNLRGVVIPQRPYHRRVYRLEDLPGLVEEYGLPGERWRTEADRVFDVYIEAQIWDDAAVAVFR
jgi:hypothetical protein